jgi:hypothetical protein
MTNGFQFLEDVVVPNTSCLDAPDSSPMRVVTPSMRRDGCLFTHAIFSRSSATGGAEYRAEGMDHFTIFGDCTAPGELLEALERGADS